jgi:membrane-associated phospholipid phosphatase
LVGGLRRLSDHSVRVLSAVSGLLFVVLAILVGLGSFSGVDQWSVDHLMPGPGEQSQAVSIAGSLFPIFDPGKEHGRVAIAAVTYGVVWLASAIPAVILVVLALAYLRSRSKRRLAIGLGLAFLAANLIELIGKTVITRPALFAFADGGRTHVVPFDTSFPSGHEIRAVLLVACLIASFPKLWPFGLGWLAAVSVMLVVGGWHTPTDVAGGLLATIAVIGAILAVSRPVRNGGPLPAARGGVHS